MFSSSSKRPDRTWGTLSFPLYGYRGSFSGVKWPGREAEHSHSSSAEVKNERDILLPHTSSFMAWIGRTLPVLLLHIFTLIKNVRHPAGRLLTQYSM